MPDAAATAPAPDWDALIADAASDPLALARLADRLAVHDERQKARDLCARALALAPDEPEIVVIAAELMSEAVPAWHGTIINDRARNEAFEEALRHAIKPGMRVLEVGAGTGLLAMMAARAGAAEVITCESNPLIAERARAIVAQNGHADRITVIAKHSNELRIGQDLSGPADVFVSEIISDTLLGEYMLPVVEDVVPRLLKPGAAVIPYRGAIRIALGYYGGADLMRMTEVEGFDLSGFNRLLSPGYALPIEDSLLTLSSAAAELFGFDFASGGPFPDRRAEMSLRARERANGVVQWIRIRTDEHSHYENVPRSGEGSSWGAGFHPFPAGRIVEPGEDVVVQGSHGQTTLRIWTRRT